jgi:hypothetical protein
LEGSLNEALKRLPEPAKSLTQGRGSRSFAKPTWIAALAVRDLGLPRSVAAEHLTSLLHPELKPNTPAWAKRVQKLSDAIRKTLKRTK